MDPRPALVTQEQWLRRSGLPFVIPARRRLAGLLPRASAVLITFTFLAFALLVADAAVSAGTVIRLSDLTQHPTVLAWLGVATALALCAIPAGLLYGRWQRRRSLAARLVWAGVVWFLWLIGLSAAAALTGARFGLHLAIEWRLGLLVLAVTLAFLELDQIVGWAARRSLHELAAAVPAVARILPILLLTVLLAFFTGELWQIAATISKARMWALGLFLVALIVVIVLPATLDMLDDEDAEEEGVALLCGTPFEGVAPTPGRLSLGERCNLLTVSMAVQAVQIALFVVLTFGVFAVFGAITLTPELITRWSQAPAHSLVWLGVELPMDWSMFRVCLILALFAGVSFAASTLMDQLYRGLFLDRVAAEVRRNVAARHCYRTTLLAAGKMPTRWQSIVAE